jgi:hypothetical protein
MTDPAEFEERADLSDTERRQMSDAIRLKAALVHEIIREEGEEELARSVSALAWSGLAAGLSMGFSLIFLTPRLHRLIARLHSLSDRSQLSATLADFDTVLVE